MKIINKEELVLIVDLANSVPDKYQEKCFGILLSHYLVSTETSNKTKNPIQTQEKTEKKESNKSRIIPIDVKAFLTQYGLSEDILWKFFIIENEEIRPIYKLKTSIKAEAVNQYALMMSLQNAIVNGIFSVRIEDLKAYCLEQKCYDPTNFTKQYKRRKSYYRNVDSVDTLVLSPEGKTALADLLEELEE